MASEALQAHGFDRKPLTYREGKPMPNNANCERARELADAILPLAMLSLEAFRARAGDLLAAELCKAEARGFEKGRSFARAVAPSFPTLGGEI